MLSLFSEETMCRDTPEHSVFRARVEKKKEIEIISCSGLKTVLVLMDDSVYTAIIPVTMKVVECVPMLGEIPEALPISAT